MNKKIILTILLALTAKFSIAAVPDSLFDHGVGSTDHFLR